ncbi:glycosyltransferase family 4 protein [Vulgatibacter sp.]|uniref:glycosyltransferase family 4 protein n=1 Tax=Vulgatibacter sp. TaxID=1971226 RepID=UPI0035664B07
MAQNLRTDEIALTSVERPRGQAIEREERVLLFVVNDLDFFLSHRLPVALAAKAARYRVHVATPSSDRATEVEALGLRHHSIPLTRKGTNPLTELRSLMALLRLLRRLKPELVHLITIKPILYGGIAARLAGVPRSVSALCGLGYVFTAQGTLARLRRRAVCAGYRIALAGRRRVALFQNPDDRSTLLDAGILPPSRTRLIRGSGVDPSVYTVGPRPTGTPIVLIACRLLREKGVPEFIKAARVLRSRGNQARFVVVGSPDHGNPTSMTEAELAAAQDEGVIEWWGRRTDMHAVLNKATIVCLPSSYGEGVPKVLIEAASCGRALVSSDVAGCREIVKDRQNGLLVPPGDVERLASAIAELLGDPERCWHLGAAGRRFVQREFSLDSVVSRTLALYEELFSDDPVTT